MKRATKILMTLTGGLILVFAGTLIPTPTVKYWALPIVFVGYLIIIFARDSKQEKG